MLTVCENHSTDCSGHNNDNNEVRSHYSPRWKKSKTHCSAKETKMQGEEKLQGEKNADTHFFFQRAMGQQFEAHKTI